MAHLRRRDGTAGKKCKPQIAGERKLDIVKPVETGCSAPSGLARPQAPTRLASNRGPNSGADFAALRSAPWRPTGGNLVRFCDIRRPWTCSPSTDGIGSATGLSATARVVEHHAPIASLIARTKR